jgi:hypothetical protein
MKVSPHTAQAFANAPHGTRCLPLPTGRRLAFRCRAAERIKVGSQPGFRLKVGDYSPGHRGRSSRLLTGERRVPRGAAGAPPPTRRNLHDTRLEPAKRAAQGCTLGSRTSKPFGCRHSCFAPLAGWPGSLVTEDPEEVCRLSPQDDVAHRRNPYPPHYRAAFASSSILCPQPRQVILRLPCPRRGETTRLPRSVTVTERVRFCLSTGGATAACR